MIMGGFDKAKLSAASYFMNCGNVGVAVQADLVSCYAFPVFARIVLLPLAHSLEALSISHN